MSLPSPRSSRWQPLRSGLMNLYLYDELELRYEDGRMLLRGNNGTGKSRILALQLPFLLDGEITPTRLEPDGDASKRIEWHLLMDGRYPDRVGYTWLELGRLGDDGAPRFVTLGCGMKAVQGKGAPARWFFVTDQRVGEDLRLKSGQSVPFKRAALEEEIGQRGRVFDKARDYRAAVDHELFQLGEQRYEALLSLLIELRRPQLSRKLDEKQMSGALSRALPPVSESVLADVAEAFRSLESDRRALAENERALDATLAFTRSYGEYVRVATRRRATAARKAHSTYEQAQRDLRVAEQELDEAERALAAIDDELAAVVARLRAATVAVRELEQDPANRDARRLDDARLEADRAERDAEGAAAARERAAQDRARSTEALARAAARVTEERQALDKAVADAERLAEAVDLADLFAPAGAARRDRGADRDAAVDARRRRDEVPGDGTAGPSQPDATRDRDLGAEHPGRAGVGDAEAAVGPDEIARARQRLAERKRHHAHLEGLAQQRAALRDRFGKARDAADDARAELDRALERESASRERRRTEHEKLEAGVQAWLDALTELESPDGVALLERLADWAERGEGPAPVAEAAEDALRSASERLVRERSRLEGQRAAVEEQRRAAVEERDGLASGRHRPPTAPIWRDDAAREGREGAPLWALTDFHDDVSPEARAGFEAALEAAGVLDAWITPDGRVLDVPDAFARAGRSTDASLAGILRPAIDPDDPRARCVDPATVAQILSSIGAAPDEAAPWVAPDGRFAIGPLAGRSAPKDAAEHIGHGAREQARRRRIGRLEAEIAEHDAALGELDGALAEVDDRAARARRERAAAPGEDPLRDATGRPARTSGVGSSARRSSAKRARRSRPSARSSRPRSRSSSVTPPSSGSAGGSTGCRRCATGSRRSVRPSPPSRAPRGCSRRSPRSSPTGERRSGGPGRRTSWR